MVMSSQALAGTAAFLGSPSIPISCSCNCFDRFLDPLRNRIPGVSADGSTGDRTVGVGGGEFDSLVLSVLVALILRDLRRRSVGS